MLLPLFLDGNVHYMRLFIPNFHLRYILSTTFLLLVSILSVRAQIPVITSFTATSVCQGSTITITGTGFTGTTAVKAGSLDVSSFTVNSPTSITAVVADEAVNGTVIVTTPDGKDTSSGILTVLPSPKPVLKDSSNAQFTNCDGKAQHRLSVINASVVTGTGNIYEINWGDNAALFTQTDWPAGERTSHVYNTQGYFAITITIKPVNGCTRTRTYQFYNGINPIASFTTSFSTTGLCAPAPIEFQIGNWTANSTGTTYDINFGDGSPHVVLSHPLSADIHKLTHQYLKASCPDIDFTATLQAINGCYTTTYTLNQIIIRKKPIVDFSIAPSPVCLDVPVCFSNQTTNGSSGNNFCDGSSDFLWDFGDGSTSNLTDPPCHQYAKAGTYDVTLTASNSSCGSDMKTKQLIVTAVSPPPVVTASPVAYCEGATAVPLMATGTGLLWYLPDGRVVNVAPTPGTNITGTTIYYVTQTLTRSCESAKVPVTVIINAIPNSPATSNIAYCQGQSAIPLMAGGSNLLWYPQAVSNTGVLSVAPTPSTAAVGTTTWYVSQTINGCESPRAGILVTVDALPVAPVVVSPVTYCQNQASVPLTATGTNLLWYTSAVGGIGSSTAPIPPTTITGSKIYYVNQSTGCGESPRAAISVNVNAGPSATIAYTPSVLCNTATSPVAVTHNGSTGGSYAVSPSGLTINPNTGEITPLNAQAGVYTITYTILSSGGCANYTTSTTVTVSGAPTATISYRSVCTSDAATPVQLTGTSGGSFASNITGLSIDPLTGTINPATSTPGDYIVTYTIAASPPCAGFSTTAPVKITLAPSAAISYIPASLCNVTSASVPVILTGTTGGRYSIFPAGMPIDPMTGAINPSGVTPGVYTVTYTAGGTGGCADYSTTSKVTVSGAPTATINYSGSPYCGGITTPQPVSLSGTAGGVFSSGTGLSINAATGEIDPFSSTPGAYVVTYTIAASPPCQGFSTTTPVSITKAPSANISYTPATLCNTSSASVPVTFSGISGGNYSVSPAGLSVNPGTGQITSSGAPPNVYTITYTIPGAGGCANYTTSTTVTVSGPPTAAISYRSVCTSDAATPVQLTGTSGGSFTSNITGLSIDPLTGTINPATSTPGDYIVTYTIAASPPCAGFSTTAPVKITLAPSAVISYIPASLCNVASASVPVIRTGTAEGRYSIFPAGMPIDPMTGAINPSGVTPGVYTVTYTAIGTGGCADYSTTSKITISGAPTATINYSGSPYCGAITAPQPVSLSGTAGGVFSSGTGLSINATTGEIDPFSSTPGSYVVTYTIAASPPCPGYTTTANVRIDESPVITFQTPMQSVCSGETAVFVPTSTVANTSYTWSVTLPPNVAGISSGTSTGAISLSFTNTGTIVQALRVRVIPTNPSQPPCQGTGYDIVLNVKPVTPAPVTDTANFCMNATPVALTVSGTMLKWYDSNGALLNAAPVINTNVAGQFVYYVTQSNSYGCESPKSEIVAVVHPVAKVVSATGKNPTICGVPSGSIVLSVLDLNDGAIPGIPVLVHYHKFQIAHTFSGRTDASGKITIPLTAGTYSNISVETSGNCTSAQIPDVFVLKDPTPPEKPVAGYNPPICNATPLTLTALTATATQAGPIDYVWAGPAFGPFADTVKNTVITFPSSSVSDAGTYVVYAMQNNCISLPASFEIVINESPAKPVISASTPLCAGDNLFLQASSSISGNEALNYVWNGPGTGFPVNGPNATINNVKIEDAGIYSVTVSSPETGCTSTTDTMIQIGGYPRVEFAEDTVAYPTGYRFILSPVITNSADPGILPIQNYIWAPSADLSCNDAMCFAPAVTVKNNVCYNVKVTNIYGCSGSDTLCINVFCKNSQVFIPNAFAPGGNIPENKKLIVRATGISSVKSFRIFNRWGRLVFERNNFSPNSADFGWDGMVNGKVADTGVYIYTVDVICENGVTYSFKGNVTLF